MSMQSESANARPGRWQPAGTQDPMLHKHGALGQPVSRIDGPLKVQGKAQFAAEFPYEGLCYAALAFSTIARGRIAALDTAAAEAAPGVVLVMTHRNAPRMKAPSLMMSSPTAAGASDLPVMQDDEIHWNGQPIAVVLAETQEQADHAASLVTADYAPRPAVTSFDEAKKTPRQLDNILGQPPVVEIGDAEAALKGAAVQVDQIYRTPRHNHNAIELHAATVAWSGDELRVHDASQLLDLTAGQLPTSSAWSPTRSASPPPSSAAVSAANACGTTRSSPAPPPGSPAGRCASCCRAWGCSAAAAAGR